MSQYPSITRHTVLPRPGFSAVEVRLPSPPHVTVENGSGRSGKPLSPEQIVRATGECFAEHGYDGTTIRVIAARLGCAVGSIYRHFEDKRSLLLAVAERAMRPALQAIEHGATLEISTQRYIESATEHGELYRMMFWLAAQPGGGRLPGIVERLIEQWAIAEGDLDRAQQRWAQAHSRILLGLGQAASTQSPGAPNESEIFPIAIAEAEVEDVTLL